MKKHILFVLLIPLCAGLKAQQQYVRCLDDGVMKWSSITYKIDVGYHSKEYIVNGDTIINDVRYKKIHLGLFDNFEETNTNWKNNFSIDSEEWWIGGEYFIRESEDASRLYALNIRTNKEYLFFDLNLQEGDEFQFTDMSNDHYYLTFTVDSVYIKDGLKHVQFDETIGLFGEELHRLTFIEGVGPNLWSIPWINYRELINCFQNQTLFYKNPYVPFPCGYFLETASIPTVFSQANYTIQQTDNGIEIRFLSPINAQLAVYDLRGRLYYANDHVFEESLIIPTASFPKGIYLLKILDKNNNQKVVSKIIL